MIKVIYNLFYDDKEEEKFKDSIFEKKFGEVKKKEWYNGFLNGLYI